MAKRVDSPYDYYGNPAGWVPMLSFQTNLALFDAETEDALRTLFLAHWIEKTQNRQRKATETVKAAIEQLHKEAQQAEKDYEAAITKITADSFDEAQVIVASIREAVQAAAAPGGA